MAQIRITLVEGRSSQLEGKSFFDGSDCMGCERRQKVQDDSHIFGMSNWRIEVVIISWEEQSLWQEERKLL